MHTGCEAPSCQETWQVLGKVRSMVSQGTTGVNAGGREQGALLIAACDRADAQDGYASSLVEIMI